MAGEEVGDGSLKRRVRSRRGPVGAGSVAGGGEQGYEQDRDETPAATRPFHLVSLHPSPTIRGLRGRVVGTGGHLLRLSAADDLEQLLAGGARLGPGSGEELGEDLLDADLHGGVGIEDRQRVEEGAPADHRAEHVAVD